MFGLGRSKTARTSTPPDRKGRQQEQNTAEVPPRPRRNWKQTRYALKSAGLAFVVGFLSALILIADDEMVRWFGFSSGEISIAGVCVLMTVFITPVISVTGYRLYSTRSTALGDNLRRRNYWVGRATITVVLTFGLTALCMGVFYLVEQLFTGVELNMEWGVTLATMYATGLAFGTAYYVSSISKDHLLRLIAVTLGLGLLVSFLIVQDDEWWTNSISFLGHAEGSSIFFNLSIIAVGLIALTLSQDLLDDLDILSHARLFPRLSYRIFKYGLIIVSAGIIGVGLFPTTVSTWSDTMHNISAHGMAIVLIIGMFTIGFIAPRAYPLSFIGLSFLFGLACAFAIYLHFVPGVLNFVALELVLFALFGAWIFLFERYTTAFINKQDPAVIRERLAENPQ